jgi:hypothetical protein
MLKLSFDPNTNAMESTVTSITENGMLEDGMRRATRIAMKTNQLDRRSLWRIFSRRLPAVHDPWPIFDLARFNYADSSSQLIARKSRGCILQSNRQLFIRPHSETFSVVTICVSNPILFAHRESLLQHGRRSATSHF